MRSVTKLSLTINLLVALVSAGLSLVLLLIAPLGLAAVVSLTAWIALCSLVGGVVGDVVLLQLLPPAAANGVPGKGRQRLRLPTGR